MEDPRRYVRAMNFVRTRIENGTFKPHELLPSIQELSDQTGHSRHTIGKALRLLQEEGLVERTPGLGYCATGREPAPARRLTPVPVAAVVNGHGGSPLGLGGESRGGR